MYNDLHKLVLRIYIDYKYLVTMKTFYDLLKILLYRLEAKIIIIIKKKCQG